ncbi:chemotaxis protein [Desulfovibrio sp. OttesenSCG-928-F07]|nr:chemotaxis protein [Desulfovibrio sp. OttesenSCG-928-F07]
MSQDYARDKNTTALEVIEFYLDEVLPDGTEYRSYYGMNVAKVLEIIRLPGTITGMPGKQHEAAMGTFNLRDRVMPLVDLGLWLGKQIVEDENRKVVVSEFSGIVTAFVVSGVTRIHRMNWGQVEPPGRYLQYFSHDSVTGVVRFEERIVFLLDMEQIIASMNPSLSLESSANQIAANPAVGQGRNVLIADDSATIRKTLSHTLTSNGYTVHQATCGREAWSMLEAWRKESSNTGEDLSKFIDLVISDIEMPEMDGHELTKRIKSDPVLQKLPVVLFSSLISDVVKEDGRKAGADDQISKPDLPYLATRVKELIEKHSAA